MLNYNITSKRYYAETRRMVGSETLDFCYWLGAQFKVSWRFEDNLDDYPEGHVQVIERIHYCIQQHERVYSFMVVCRTPDEATLVKLAWG